MLAQLYSTPVRFAVGALASATLAAFLLMANPFPTEVHGQAPQPAATTGNQATTQVQTTGQTPARPATAVQTSGQVPAAVNRQAVAQQPVALPRSGVGLEADQDVDAGTFAYGLLALSAALGSAAVVLRARRSPR